MNVNLTLVKVAFVLVTAPFWLPFLKALWEEFNEALAEDGGLLGGRPTPREREEIRDEQKGLEDPLVHEPWVRPGDRRSRGFLERGARRPASGRTPGPGRPRFR